MHKIITIYSYLSLSVMSWALEKSQDDGCKCVQIPPYEWVLSLSVENPSCHLVILSSKLLSVVSTHFTTPYISYALFTSFVSDLIAHI